MQETIIGWRESLALPALGIPAIKAKIDTGARSSALHVAQLETYQQEQRKMARFLLHPIRKRQKIEIPCHAEIKDERVVSDSGGHREKRVVIETLVELNGAQWPIEITLSNRENMLFRMLLGRTAMHGRFLVDPTKSYLCSPRRIRKAYRSKKRIKPNQ